MRSTSPKVRGIFLLGIYICLIALSLIQASTMAWLKPAAQWSAVPLLIIFFYLNTAIDSKFEKRIFYGLSLFALSVLLPIARPVLGSYTIYLVLATWMIAYMSYARGLLCIISMGSSYLFERKGIAAGIFAAGLLAAYFFVVEIAAEGMPIFPWICLALTLVIFMMATVNLRGQLHGLLANIFLVAALLLLCFNYHLALNISSNISIFDSASALFFFTGQLAFIFVATRCAIQFRHSDHSDISSVLKIKK